jgi:ParB family chromosome partitioning protein
MTTISETLKLDDIEIADRLRDADPAHVAALAESIGQIGLQVPIRVRIDREGAYHLIAGLHRIEACRMAGLNEIECLIEDGLNALSARMIEIDENLIRHELNPLDRATFLAERKRIYEELHPETRAGVAGGKARQGRKSATAIFAVANGSQEGASTFSEDVATRTRLNARTVRRAVEVHSRLAPEVRRRLSGTHIAQKEGELFALSRQSPERQIRIVDLVLAEGGPKTVRQAIEQITPTAQRTSPDEAAYKALLSAWRRCSPAMRQRFLDDVVGEGVS